MNIKICGIQTASAAVIAYKAGATHIGINFIPSSPRFAKPSSIENIIATVYGKVKIVGIFQDMPSQLVNDICKLYKLDFAQLHGNESPEYCRQLNTPVIKAVPINSDRSPQDIATIMRTYVCSAFLLDRATQGQGNNVDLAVAYQLSQQFPCFLAGGLTPENITHTVTTVHPFGVDVAGGIETDNIFDPQKVKQFIQNAKEIHS